MVLTSSCNRYNHFDNVCLFFVVFIFRGIFLIFFVKLSRQYLHGNIFFSDRKNFNYLKKNYLKILKLKSPFIEKTISDSCKIKKDIVQQDEKENKLRKILNLGHTFAHAYEAALSYSKKLNHGEAVILGVVSSAKFSVKNNILNKKDYKQIINHINNLKIPVNLNFYFKKKDINLIIKYMKSDKKNNSSKINLILIKKIGKVILNLKYSQSKIKKFLIDELIY